MGHMEISEILMRQRPSQCGRTLRSRQQSRSLGQREDRLSKPPGFRNVAGPLHREDGEREKKWGQVVKMNSTSRLPIKQIDVKFSMESEYVNNSRGFERLWRGELAPIS